MEDDPAARAPMEEVQAACVLTSVKGTLGPPMGLAVTGVLWRDGEMVTSLARHRPVLRTFDYCTRRHLDC